MNGYDPSQDLAAIRAERQAATEVVLSCLDRVLAEADGLQGREPAAAAAVRRAALAAVEACDFQDIVGQRLTRLAQGRPADPLLQGPATSAAALDQEAVDRLLARG